MLGKTREVLGLVLWWEHGIEPTTLFSAIPYHGDQIPLAAAIDPYDPKKVLDAILWADWQRRHPPVYSPRDLAIDSDISDIELD